MRELRFPVTREQVDALEVGETILISGRILCGRDAVLPRIARSIEDGTWDTQGIDLQGSLIFHTAVSVAGVGPTSSNKKDIESTIPILSEHGVRMHLGKGELSAQTIAELDAYHSVYAVIPPVTALLRSKTLSQRVVAFEEEGMEALHELDVDKFPAVVAAVHGRSIYGE